LGARGAPGAVGAGEKQRRAGWRMFDDAPAEAPAVAGSETGGDAGCVNAGHFGDAFFGEEADAVERSAIQNRLIEASHISSRGIESAGWIGGSRLRGGRKW